MDQQAQTLVLRQDYTPIGVVPWYDAITLYFKDKVEIIEEYDGFVRSTKLVMKIPAVVRLLRRFKRDSKRVKFSRISVYARDGYKCQYCGVKKTISELTYDHVLPRAQGGKTEWTNIVSACSECNEHKGNRTPEKARMKLISKPVEPKIQPEIMFEISRTSVPDAWRDYLYWTGTLEP